MQEIMSYILIYVIIIGSAIFHEYAHARVANSLGDSTAKEQGRLTLNPIAHIDLFGTVLLPFFLMLSGGIFIGYAKPIPIEPSNFDDKKYGLLKVALSGPLTNFLIALVFSTIFRIYQLPNLWATLFTLIIYVNIILGLFNLIPVPPLDGSKIISTFAEVKFTGRRSLLGIIVALFIAFTILPTVSEILFELFTGASF